MPDPAMEMNHRMELYNDAMKSSSDPYPEADRAELIHRIEWRNNAIKGLQQQNVEEGGLRLKYQMRCDKLEKQLAVTTEKLMEMWACVETLHDQLENVMAKTKATKEPAK